MVELNIYLANRPGHRETVEKIVLNSSRTSSIEIKEADIIDLDINCLVRLEPGQHYTAYEQAFSIEYKIEELKATISGNDTTINWYKKDIPHYKEIMALEEQVRELKAKIIDQ